jgi:predicted permease
MRRFLARLASLFRSSSAERELMREIEAHIAMLQESFEECGLRQDEAKLAALRAYGGVEQAKELHREARSLLWIEHALKDIRYGGRTFLRTPGFTAVAVLSLALGIAANTTIFSVINAVLLRRLPYPNSDRLLTIVNRLRKQPEQRRSVSTGDLLHWNAENTVFERIEGTEWGVEPNALSGAGTPERVGLQYVTWGLCPMLGVRPVLGSVFPENDAAKKDLAGVFITYEFWQRHFAGDPKVVGRSLFIDNSPGWVMAVLPPGFDLFGQGGVDVLEPIGLDRMGPSAAQRWLMGVGKLKPGISIEQAQASMDVVAHHLEQAYPDINKGLGVLVQSLRDGLFGWSREILYPLFGAVGFVLLIGCSNIANLLLSRAATRRKEIGIRVALGAGRLRLIRQMLTESVLLSFGAGILGLLFSIWGIKLFVAISPQWFPHTKVISIDSRVLWFTFAISVLTGILFGLAPALRASKTDLNDSLKEGGRSSASGSRHRTRSALVVVEVAMALVLLVGAGLMMNTLIRVLRADPGFNPNKLVTLEVRLIGRKYLDDSQWEKTSLDLITPKIGDFCRELLVRVKALPGVDSAAVIDWVPMSDDGWPLGYGFTIAGRPTGTSGEQPQALLSAVSADYFRVMQIPLLRGRQLTEHDFRTAPWIVVINQAMAKKYWPNQDPIGQVITVNQDLISAEEQPREIVGVAGNVRQLAADRDPVPEVYFPYLQQPAHCFAYQTETRLHKSLIVKTSLATRSLVDSLRTAVIELDKDSPVFGVRTVQEVVSSSSHMERFYTILLGIFAAIALLLAAIGIYGVISYSVSERRHEIGLRVALGAQSSQVLQLVVKEGLLLSLIGVAIGLVASFGAAPLIGSFLYGVKPHDPPTLILVSIFLVGITALATYIPARRAMMVDPIVTLRHE